MAADELFSPEIAELESFIDSYVSDRALNASLLMHSPPKQSGFNNRSSSSDSKDSHFDRLSSTESRGSHNSFTRNSSKESDFLASFQDELLLHQRDQNLNYENKVDPAFASMHFSGQNYVPPNPNYNTDASTSAHALAMQLRAVRQNYENEIRPHVQIQENRGLNEVYQDQPIPATIPTSFQQPVQWEQEQQYYQILDPQMQQQVANAAVPMWDNNQTQTPMIDPYNPQLQQYVSAGGLQQIYPEATTFATAGSPNIHVMNGGSYQLQQQGSLPNWVDVSVPPPSWHQQQMYASPPENVQLQQVSSPATTNQGVYVVKKSNSSPINTNNNKPLNAVTPDGNLVSNTPQSNNSGKTKKHVSPKTSLNPEQQSPNAGAYQTRVFKRSTSSSSSNNPRRSSSGRYSEADKDENWRESCKQNRRQSSATTDDNKSEKDDGNVSVFSDKSDKSPKHKQVHKTASNRVSNGSTASNENKNTNSSTPKTISARSKADIKNILGGREPSARNRNQDNNSFNDKFDGMRLESEAELQKFISTAQAYSTNESKMREMAEIVCNKAIQNPMFGRKAALLCKRMSSYMTQGTKFRSVVLNIMQGHYRNCQQLLNMMISTNGKDVRLLGYITFLAEFFVNVPTKNGAHLKLISSPNLNRPLIDCLTCTLELTGKLLEMYNSKKMSNLMSEVRNQCIVSPSLTKPLKCELLRIIEVYASNWSKLGDSTNEFYTKKVTEDKTVSENNEKKHPRTKKTPNHAHTSTLRSVKS